MNPCKSILNTTNLDEFYFQLKNIESKRAGFLGRLVVIHGSEYYLSSIIDKYFELIRNRENDPDCLIPKIYKILSDHQNEFYSLYSSAVAHLLPDYLGEKQAQLVSEIQLNLSEILQKEIYWQKSKNIENFCDNFSKLKLTSSKLLILLHSVFTNKPHKISNQRQKDLLFNSCKYLLENKSSDLFDNLHLKYGVLLSFLENEVKMDILLKILKEEPEFCAKILSGFNLLKETLPKNQHFSLLLHNTAQLCYNNLPIKLWIRRNLNHSHDQLSNYFKNVILFLCAKKGDPDSNLNKDSISDIIDLIIKISVENMYSKVTF